MIYGVYFTNVMYNLYSLYPIHNNTNVWHIFFSYIIIMEKR